MTSVIKTDIKSKFEIMSLRMIQSTGRVSFVMEYNSNLAPICLTYHQRVPQSLLGRIQVRLDDAQGRDQSMGCPFPECRPEDMKHTLRRHCLGNTE